MECYEDIGGVHKRIITQECETSCDKGFEYRPSDNTSAVCCGRCVKVGCVVDGEVKNVGDEWYSDDYCVKNICLAGNDTVNSYYPRNKKYICHKCFKQTFKIHFSHKGYKFDQNSSSRRISEIETHF